MYFVILLILLAVTHRINTQTISLEYKRNRPFYHPNPGSVVGQIIPPGKPWPANPEDYANFSQTTTLPQVIQPSLVDRNKDETPTAPNNRPSFHPNPGSVVGQIIPPGKPWPANPENQTVPPLSNQPNLVDRINEVTQTVPNNRPSFHPKPGGVVGQIVPAGKPWPANTEDYITFSRLTSTEDSNEESTTTDLPTVATTTSKTKDNSDEDDDDDDDEDDETSTTSTTETTEQPTRITNGPLYTSVIQNTLKPQIKIPKVTIKAATTTTTQQPKITQRYKKATVLHRPVPNINRVPVKPRPPLPKTIIIPLRSPPKPMVRIPSGIVPPPNIFRNVGGFARPVAFHPPPLVFHPPPVPICIPIIG